MMRNSRKIKASLTRGSSRNKGNITNGRGKMDAKMILLVAMAVILLALHRLAHLVIYNNDEQTLANFHKIGKSNEAIQLPRKTQQQQAFKQKSSSITSGGSSGMNIRQPQTFLSPIDPSLPAWIRDYITWHREIRAKYPKEELFNNPNAPNVLIRTCLGLCGGLNDRLGQLPWDLYLANQTKRVLFMLWSRPKPLEDFLLPHAFNWSVPPGLPHFNDLHDIKANVIDMFENYTASNPTDQFWRQDLDAAIERANHGEFKNIKVLRHRMLGHLHEHELEQRLQALGETDMLHFTPSFGKIFWMFFKPVPAIEMELENVYRALKLEAGKYTAVHCRVRHPKAFSKKQGLVKGKWDRYPADKTGLPWEGKTREFAVETATDALQCAQTLLNYPKEPIYFFSDSNDLVHYMSHELNDPNFVSANQTILQGNKVDAKALQLVQSNKVVAREVTMENAHIDKQKGRPPEAYYGTFIDLMLAVNARCVTFGVGFYAVFATKISGIQCKRLYTEEAWGGSERKALLAEVCDASKIGA